MRERAEGGQHRYNLEREGAREEGRNRGRERDSHAGTAQMALLRKVAEGAGPRGSTGGF